MMDTTIEAHAKAEERRRIVALLCSESTLEAVCEAIEVAMWESNSEACGKAALSAIEDLIGE